MRLEGIDILRGLAIILVVAYHFFELLGLQDHFLYTYFSHLGQLGVPLFFIISGYLIYRSIEHNITTKGIKKGLKTYFLHRLFRIMPAYIVNFFILFFLAIYILHTMDTWSTSFIIKQIFTHLTFTSYFLYKTSGLGINGAYWTLSIEMLWYFIAPLFFLYIKKDRYYLFLIVLAIVYLLSIDLQWLDNILNLDASKPNYLALQYFYSFQLPAQILYFIAGIFIYKHMQKTYTFSSVTRYILFLLLLLFFYYLSNQKFFLESFFVKNMIIVVIVSILFILFYQHYSSSLIPLAWIGKISYSMYLWHMPILALMHHYHTLSIFSLWINFLLFSSILLLISSMSYYLIEESGFKLRKKLENQKN